MDAAKFQTETLPENPAEATGCSPEHTMAIHGPNRHGAARRPPPRSVSSGSEGAAAGSMKNGLYSIHTYMLDGVRGRDSGIMILRDGVLLGGGPHSWSTGSYTAGQRPRTGHP